MAGDSGEPIFSTTEFTPEERARMRRVLWYTDRSDFLWATIRKWLVGWTVLAIAIMWLIDYLKAGAKWLVKWGASQ